MDDRPTYSEQETEMHSDTMSGVVSDFFDEANTLQRGKNADYHPDKVAYLEILRTAWECRMTVEQDLWAKVRKQYVALRSYVLDGQVASEPGRSRMMDVAVYMGMMACWDEHKLTIVRDAMEFVGRIPCPTLGDTIVACPDKSCDRCQFYSWLIAYAVRLNNPTNPIRR